MPHIFTYGSLMFDPVWSRVVTGSYDRCPAVLREYERKGVQDEVYPVIVPSAAHSQVEGIVYLDVSSPDLAKIDIFEGQYYFRKAEKAATSDNRILPVEVYVLKEEYYSIMDYKEWDPVYFSSTGIKFFIHKFMKTDVQ